MNLTSGKLFCCLALCINLLQLVHSVCCSNESIGENLAVSANKSFEISIIHINDFHARFEETNVFSSTCKRDQNQTCIGGYARAVTVIKDLLHTRKNPIYLNAGDNFSGTLWYSLGRWNVTSYFFNLLKADVITLGNHDFDNSIDGIVPFLDAIESPIVVSNFDDSEEPKMQGKYNKSIVIEREGRKIGIIGVLTRDTILTADVKKIKILDEIESVKIEAAALKDQGVDIIIVLSHCGIELDYEIAKSAGHQIDIIVGGHSHTFMYSGNGSFGPDKPEDEYPAVVHTGRRKVLIVQASAFLKYVGDIVVHFDENNNIIGWIGSPIFLDSRIAKDEDILQHLQPWKDRFNELSSQIVGETDVDLRVENCFSEECNIADFVTDAFAYHYKKKLNRPEVPVIAFTVAGSIRVSIKTGPITFGDLATVLPFGSSIDMYELSGEHLLEAFEYSVNKTLIRKEFFAKNMMQVSGAKVVYNVTLPVGKRVVSAEILHNDHYEPLQLSKTYHVVSSDYLNGGGDGYTMVKNYKKNHILGPLDIDLIRNYLKETGTVTISSTGRITILQ